MKLAILGCGQLGGSFALALKEAQADLIITGYDPIAAHSGELLARGALDAIASTPADAAESADIVLLAAPLRSYPQLAEAIAPVLKTGTIVTDVGSVKAPMLRLAALLPTARTVPAHPIAGTEKSGPSIATAGLFRGRLCLLTPTDDTDARAAVETLWHLVGSDTVEMPTEVHDQIYAQVSHLPHFIAFVTAQFLYRRGVRINDGDGMLAQFLRISRSDSRMWTDVALENREALLAAFATYTSVLHHMVAELKSGAPGTPADATTVAKTLLPRVLASALISTISLYERQSGMSLKPFAGAGLRDISAPALTAPEGDIEAISHAAGAVAVQLEALLVEFHAVERLIGAEDAQGLLDTVTAMRADAQALAATKN